MKLDQLHSLYSSLKSSVKMYDVNIACNWIFCDNLQRLLHILQQFELRENPQKNVLIFISGDNKYFCGVHSNM